MIGKDIVDSCNVAHHETKTVLELQISGNTQQ
jgi:hypothetical protein